MNKKSLIIVVSVIIALIISIIVYNCISNLPGFLEVNAINCISAFIVVGVSFFIVQRQTDYRKQKDIFIKLLETLKLMVDDGRSYQFTNVSQEEILMRIRDMSLKIEVIKKYADRFAIQPEVKFLEDKFEEYQGIIDRHMGNLDILYALTEELKRPLNLISQKLFEIMLNLYQ